MLVLSHIDDYQEKKQNIAYQTYSRELNNRLWSKIQSDWNSVHDQSVPSATAGKIRVKGKCLDEYGFVKEVVRQGIFYLWKQLGGSHNDQ